MTHHVFFITGTIRDTQDIGQAVGTKDICHARAIRRPRERRHVRGDAQIDRIGSDQFIAGIFTRVDDKIVEDVRFFVDRCTKRMPLSLLVAGNLPSVLQRRLWLAQDR